MTIDSQLVEVCINDINYIVSNINNALNQQSALLSRTDGISVSAVSLGCFVLR